MQLTLSHLRYSRSQRIIWLLEELKFEYSLADTPNLEFEFLFQQNRSNIKYPTLEVNYDTHCFHLTESSAIAEFLSNQFQTLVPTNSDHITCAQWTFWKNFCDANLMPNIVLKQIFSQIVRKTPLPFKPVSWCFKQAFDKMYLNKEISGQLEMINHHVQANEYLMNDTFTYADILMWFPLQVCEVSIDSFELKYPYISKYLINLRNRSAFKAACSSGSWSIDEFKEYWSTAW